MGKNLGIIPGGYYQKRKEKERKHLGVLGITHPKCGTSSC
jgi:hypothetical protein